MGISSYQDLKGWQLSMDVVEHVYQLTLGAQVALRAAFSPLLFPLTTDP